jgi:hypothetical protein
VKTLRQILTESVAGAIDISKWKKIGDRLGSNPGGVHTDESGDHWYVKHSHTDDHAKNEHAAHLFYKAAGSPVLDYHLIKKDNKLGVATKWTKKENFDVSNPSHVKEIQKHFGTHAWTANWDSVGLEDDNQAITHKGMTTLDTGGALNYRAMGGPKGDAFGYHVHEFDSLREHQPKVFGRMSPKDIVDSVRRVAKVPDEHIHQISQEHGPGTRDERTELGHKMVARKHDLISKANKLASLHKIDPIDR